jgi:Uma2 family endonuclease
MDAIDIPTEKMTPDDFLRWSQDTGAERVELLNGFVVQMMSETGLHARTKHRAAIALENAVRQNKTSCIVYPDGMTVRAPDGNVFVPDAILQCENIDTSAVVVSDPLIVVEVFSKSTRHIDTGRKLASYFEIPSVQHYLMIDADRKLVIHHRRTADGVLAQFYPEGTLRLDPPGLSIPVTAFFDI